MNEADTRAELIDPQLKLAGWGDIAESRVQREYNINAVSYTHLTLPTNREV